MTEAARVQEYVQFAILLQNRARQVLSKKINAELSVFKKADNSYVTNLDKELEQTLREVILDRYPTHGVIGEEFGVTNQGAEFAWTLDPIDGTEELVCGVPLWGTIISLLHDDSPIVGLIDHPILDICTVGGLGVGVQRNEKRLSEFEPARDAVRLYCGSKHQFARGEEATQLFDRVTSLFPNVRIFCTCYGFSSLIAGEADVAVEYDLKVWDLMAVEVLVRELGGDFVKIGQRYTATGELRYGAVFGKPGPVQQIIDAI